MAVIIATIFLFSCDSNKHITSFKIKNPYLSDRDRNFVLNVDSQTIISDIKSLLAEPVTSTRFKCPSVFLNEIPIISETIIKVG